MKKDKTLLKIVSIVFSCLLLFAIMKPVLGADPEVCVRPRTCDGFTCHPVTPPYPNDYEKFGVYYCCYEIDDFTWGDHCGPLP